MIALAAEASEAAGAMLIQDIAGVLLVQAEARNRGMLSAVFDSVMWLAGIVTTTVSVTTLQGHHLNAKVIILVAVELANVAGCVIGVKVGKRWIKERKEGKACEHCEHTRAATGT